MNYILIPEKFFIDKSSLKLIPFISEETPIEISINYNIYTKYFPSVQTLNFRLLKITNIGLYSIAKPYVSNRICQIIINTLNTTDIVITDALANVGGMTIMFAQYFTSVHACEIVPLHSNFLKNNLIIYNLLEKVNIICDDYMNIMQKLEQDVIFFDPPWGGKGYKNSSSIPIGINNINITFIINNLIYKAKYIFLRVPYNFQFAFFIKNINPLVKLKFYKINPYSKNYAQILIVIKTVV